MADESDGGEKSELPSPKRREDAIKEGRFAESPELGSSVELMAGLAVLAIFGGAIVSAELALMRKTFSGVGSGISMREHAEQLMPAVMQTALPSAFAIGFVALAIIGCCIAQVGLNLNLDWLSPKWERLNPMNGFSEMFSTGSLAGLLVGLLKLTAIGWSAYVFLAFVATQAPQWWQMPAPNLYSKAATLAGDLGWRMALPLFLIAAADYVYKRYTHEQGLKMSREELRQEHRQEDGDPKIKQRIRQIQRQRANRRMMKDVPKATVVICNPTHVAIALRYVHGEGGAPVVLAKGEDLIAQRIKAIARENGVPVLEEPPLARALLRAVEVGREIPMEFYRAVAEVLAHLYRRGGKTPGRPA